MKRIPTRWGIYSNHPDPAASWWIAWTTAARTMPDLARRRHRRAAA